MDMALQYNANEQADMAQTPPASHTGTPAGRADGGHLAEAEGEAAQPPCGPPTLGLRHVLLVYTSPRSLFSRVEDTGAYGMALVVLLALVTFIGYAQIQTGLIDRVVDQQTEQTLAELETTQGTLLDRIELRDRMDAVRKQGVFSKTVRRLGVVVFSPLYFLVSFLLIASILYAAVALTGRKPEYHTLMALCVYAGFIELFAYALQLSMMLYYGTINVDTSLGMLVAPAAASVLSAIDPFRLWFWVLVGLGVVVTRQLSRTMAVVTCSLMCLLATGVRVAVVLAGS